MNGRHPTGSGVSVEQDRASAPPVTIAEALERGRRSLRGRSERGRHEALYLLAGVLRVTQGETWARRDRRLEQRELEEYEKRLARRARGEPLQYIEGRAAFRRLSLRVNPSVLIPRPETEQLVECVLEWCRGRERLSAVDVGTGSGAIAISLAVEGPFERVVGVDISPPALNVAHENAKEAGADGKVDLRVGSLFDALRREERFDVVVANPPYIASGELDSLPAEVREWEPPVALYAGPAGSEVIERIVDEAPRHLREAGLLALEIAPGVADAAVDRVRARGAYREPRLIRDLAGRQRILLAELARRRAT